MVMSLGPSLGTPEGRLAGGCVSGLWDTGCVGSPSEVCRPDHHGCGLERVAGPLPVVPLDAVELVCALLLWVVHPVEVGRTAGVEPPACEHKTQQRLGARRPPSHHEAGHQPARWPPARSKQAPSRAGPVLARVLPSFLPGSG